MHIGQRSQAARGRHDQRAHLPGLDWPTHIGHQLKAHRRLARHQINHQIGRHTIRHVRHARPDQLLEIRARQMLRTAVAHRAVRHIGRLFNVIDEFVDVTNRQLGAHHHYVGQAGIQRHRLDIALRVVTQILVERFIRRQRAGRAHAKGVAIGRGLRQQLCAEVAARRRPVVQHITLAGGGADALDHNARNHITRATA